MKRTPLKRKTQLRARAATKRVKPTARSAPPGFPEEVRMQVRFRSRGECEVKSKVCTGTAAHFHHRKLRRHKDHTAANCLYACRACHDHIHANPTKAYLMGYLLRSTDDPLAILPGVERDDLMG